MICGIVDREPTSVVLFNELDLDGLEACELESIMWPFMPLYSLSNGFIVTSYIGFFLNILPSFLVRLRRFWN